jgi:hypothetical protein
MNKYLCKFDKIDGDFLLLTLAVSYRSTHSHIPLFLPLLSFSPFLIRVYFILIPFLFFYFLSPYLSFKFILFYLHRPFVTSLRFTVRRIKCSCREDVVDLFKILSQLLAGGTEKTIIISVLQLFSWSVFTEVVHLISHRASWLERTRLSLVFRDNR